MVSARVVYRYILKKKTNPKKPPKPQSWFTESQFHSLVYIKVDLIHSNSLHKSWSKVALKFMSSYKG